MKLLRVLAALTVASAIALGTVVPASADPTSSPIELIAPTQGEKLDTIHPVFTWIAPTDEASVEIVVSTANTTSQDGLLSRSNKSYVSSWQPDDGAATFTDPQYSYPPATYYWQVIASDAAGTPYASSVHKFIVPVFFDLKKAKTKIAKMQYNGQRAVFGNATMYCNYAQDQYYTEFVMEVWKGSKKLVTSSQSRGDCVGMFGVKSEAVWDPPASLKSGTKLTIKLYGASTRNSTVKWGGSKIKKSKGPVTTLKLTWTK